MCCCLLFGRQGPIGRFLDEQLGIVLAFRWTGAALACAIMGFPLLVRAIQLSLEAVDRRLEQAASTLGANPLYVFSTVTLPLILPGIIAGGILCFARAMGEFGATITFVSNIPGETQTLPTLIYTFTQVPGGERRRAPADADLSGDLARRDPRLRGLRRARAEAKPRLGGLRHDGHAPGQTPDGHRLLGLEAVDVDHRHVVGEAVGDVIFLAVGAELAMPGALADKDVVLHLLGGGVDHGDAIGRVLAD